MESWNLSQSNRYGYILDLIEDSDGLKDSDPRWDKSQITMLLLIIIGFLWYIFLLIVTVRFWKNVGLFNKWLLLSFISLNGSLICKIWFFTSTYVSFFWRIDPQLIDVYLHLKSLQPTYCLNVEYYLVYSIGVIWLLRLTIILVLLRIL